MIRQCLYTVLCLITNLSQFLTQGNQIASLRQIKNLLEHPLFNKPRSYLPLADVQNTYVELSRVHDNRGTPSPHAPTHTILGI